MEWYVMPKHVARLESEKQQYEMYIWVSPTDCTVLQVWLKYYGDKSG
jgi:hypothetical protein